MEGTVWLNGRASASYHDSGQLVQRKVVGSSPMMVDKLFGVCSFVFLGGNSMVVVPSVRS